ncbi:pentatricopeptide repeat-containing protein At1g08070, chloroplastic-like [Phalaenopsis equestris]|uniref:pentatricopeptide repeat-containing protein At1g08070, chloroplastic-like n=1 Tax=Phalaenopsis equestris TaxID=78828 RepID=UPI0009E4EFA2|nr:pentatricopeptide repeat-containing protein At1g08070, chloroplastic-like [Phalaenopsis equestris]
MAVMPAIIPPPLLQLPPNPRTLLLEKCKSLRDLRQIHAHLIKTGSFLHHSTFENILECSALLLPNSMDYALKLFDQNPQPHTEAFNIMIRAFILSRFPTNAVLLFLRMLASSIKPDKHTFSCILKACSRLNSVEIGKQVHAYAVKCGLACEDFVLNSLIHMYASCGDVFDARKLFDKITERGIVTWNAMFAGYFKVESWQEVVTLFHDMLALGAEFDEVTLISVLTACGRLGVLDLGQWIDVYVHENGLQSNQNLATSLVDMYAKCGQVEKARNLFNEMASRDVVAWSAMISGYSQWSQCREALKLFHDMQISGVEPNEVTMVSVLSSCAVLGALETGKWVHSYLRRKQLKMTVNLGTALVDFYAKCGFIADALETFTKMPQKNAWSWTVIIQGLASNGRGEEALKFFSFMLEADFQPNELTFMAVLSACSHAGLVDEGKRFFHSMGSIYGVEPSIEHYGIMVDMLGRSGLVQEAYDFVIEMPVKPNAVIWRTLLASCKIHKNVEIGEESLKQVVKLEPKQSGDYILLSNIYASVGRFEDAVRLRNQMKEKGIRKTPGCSSVEVDGVMHEFFAEDSAHPLWKEIYEKVDEMMMRIKEAGYVCDVAEARLDAEEEEKELSVSHHSEKLAIALGLLRSTPGAVLRVWKNLRVCRDCHVATKLISKVYGREIVVRDRNRFHHFKDGFCSCNDYW